MNLNRNKIKEPYIYMHIYSKVKLTLFIYLTILLFLFSCSSPLLVKNITRIENEMKTGFISIYMNRTIYNTKHAPSNIGGLELIVNDILLANAGKGMNLLKNDHDQKAKQQFINEISTELIKALNHKLKYNIEILPTETYTDKKMFNSPIKKNLFQNFGLEEDLVIKKKVYLNKDKLKLLTFQEIIKNIEGKEDLFIGKLMTSKDLAKFAQKLNLDGVWVAEFDLAYKFFRQINKNQFTMRASTSMKIILIDKKGKIIFESADINKGLGDRFESDIIKVNMINNKEEFDFEINHKIYQAYKIAINKNIDFLIKKIND